MPASSGLTAGDGAGAESAPLASLAAAKGAARRAALAAGCRGPTKPTLILAPALPAALRARSLRWRGMLWTTWSGWAPPSSSWGRS